MNFSSILQTFPSKAHHQKTFNSHYKFTVFDSLSISSQYLPAHTQQNIVQVSRRDIPGDTKDAQKDRIQQQSKIKVVKMLALVVILFVLSWLPLYAIFTIMKFGKNLLLYMSFILYCKCCILATPQ